MIRSPVRSSVRSYLRSCARRFGAHEDRYPGNAAPAGLPTISGTATENQTLTASAASITDADGLGTFAYQWSRDYADISGATNTTYVLTDADVGKLMRVRVSYTDGMGKPESVTSDPTAAVAGVNDSPTGSVTISGTATQGQTLTAVTATIADPDGLGAFSYQWKRGGSNISGANASTYVLVQADVGTVITVTVSYTDGQGFAESLTSAGTSAVANVNDAPTGTLTISGTTEYGNLLTMDSSSLADADGLGAFTFAWLRDGVAISGAVSSTYTLAAADIGTMISARVSYTDSQGTAESVTSSAVGPITGTVPSGWTVKDSSGTSYSVPLSVLDSAGTSYTVATTVLDSAGTSYTPA